MRGTIFYVNAYNDSLSYICTCNGSVDLQDKDIKLKTVFGPHHEGYYLAKTTSGVTLKPAPMQEHDDEEIFNQMYRLDEK